MAVTMALALVTVYLAICVLLYGLQERLLFYPERLPADYQFTFHHRFAEASIPVEGATLHALHFTVDRPQGVVLYLHGNAGSLRSWGAVASDLVVHGYDVFIPDYRGYGKSTGSISGERQLHADMAAVYAYLLERYREQDIVVYGRSIGSGLAVQLAVEQRPRRLILEAPYYNLGELASAQFPWVPHFLFKYPLRTDRRISEVVCPVDLVHGTQDEVIPYSSSARLLPHIRAERRLISIERGRHNDLGEFPQYHEYLAQAFGSTPSAQR